MNLLALGLLGLAINALTTLDCFLNHHQAYESILEIVLALVLLLLWPPYRYARMALALSIAYSVGVWLVQPFYEKHVDIDGSAVFGFIAIALVCASYGLRRNQSLRLPATTQDFAHGSPG